MRFMSFRFITLCLAILVLSQGFIFAQQNLSSTATAFQALENRPLARMYDEFEYVRPYSECDISGRLDMFVVNGLEKESNSRGYIIFYQSRRYPARHTHDAARQYLIELRGLPANRIEAIYGGYRKKAAMELWLVPPGADVPKPTPTIAQKKSRKG
jgi:hypothetical protein